jgi:type IV pilus assembly protein PilB
MPTEIERTEPKRLTGRLESVLEKAGVLSPGELTPAIEESKRSGIPLWQILITGKKISEEKLAEVLSAALHLPLVRLAASPIQSDAVQTIPEDLARKHSAVPLKKEEEPPGGRPRRPNLVVAMANPTDLLAIQELEFSSGCAVKPVVATVSEIDDAIFRHYRPESWLEGFLKNLSDESDLAIVGTALDEDEEAAQSDPESQQMWQKTPAIRLVNLILERALRQEASDIHLEPDLNHVRVRTRVQGLLQDTLQVPKWLQEPLVSRLKILAKLDISERRRPQDGRIKVSFGNSDVDIRVSTLPTHLGEKVVMRILGSGQRVPATSSLGFSPSQLAILKEVTRQPQGMVLVTGPTGAGKTTTLYSILSEKRNPSINIVSVEDPIEFQLPGISQVQINLKAGLTFAACLRSILRQDPDVILVGEIRDLETAEIAFRAAATGHLVFSTLHTNGTISTVTRLLDIGVEPYIISSSLSLIIAQRLVRNICPTCKEEYLPDSVQLEMLHLEKHPFPLYHGRGCSACGDTGYAGRTGLFEMLRITPEFKDWIHRRAPEMEMQKAAADSGTVFLVDDAIEKLKQGVTTVEEVLRVIQLQEDEIVRCPSCSNLIRLDFALCPYCMAPRKTFCASCRQLLKPEWRVCPYCSAAVSAAPAKLPAESATPPTRAAREPGETPRPAGRNETPAQPTEASPSILVVDDDPAVRRMVVKSLELLPNHPRISEAANGADGLARVTQDKPDLILLDVMMPKMDGFEFCQRLRSKVETAFIPVLMLTVNTDEEARTKGFLVGTDDFMAKPVSVPELHSRVQRLLRRTYGM